RLNLEVTPFPSHPGDSTSWRLVVFANELCQLGIRHDFAVQEQEKPSDRRRVELLKKGSPVGSICGCVLRHVCGRYSRNSGKEEPTEASSVRLCQQCFIVRTKAQLSFVIQAQQLLNKAFSLRLLFKNPS